MGVEILSANLSSSSNLWKFPIEDFLVVARPDVSGLYILNSSARIIWDLHQAGAPFEELVREFASAYDIPLELAEQDIGRTLAGWRSSLLAERATTPRAPSANSSVPADSNPDSFTQDYLIHGENVRVILQSSALIEEIAPRLDWLPRAPSTPDLTFTIVEDAGGFRLFCGECCIACEEHTPAIRTVLLQEIVRSCRGRDCLAAFHAGACGSESRCVIFPANTQSGKTTLAAVLMKMGLTLYSDDSVLLERDSLSVPVMPFSLMVREGSWDVLYSRFPELRDQPVVSRYGQQIRFLPPLGAKQDGCCPEVGAIVFPRFDQHARTEFGRLNTLEALLRLQESGFWVAHDPASITAFLEWLQSTPAFSMCFSDVDEAASIIRNLVD